MQETINLYGDLEGRVSYIDHMGNDKTIVNAARVSFGADSQGEHLTDRDRKLVAYLLQHKHSSPFEHCTVTWKFVVPLFVRSQHHRHRTFAFNEISRRYTSKHLCFYEPSVFRKQHTVNRQASTEETVSDSFGTVEHNIRALQLYENMIDAGVCREQARMVLPQSLYTEYYGTVSLHNALKFIELRKHPGAQWEIQRVAEAMQEHLWSLYPETILVWTKLRGS